MEATRGEFVNAGGVISCQTPWLSLESHIELDRERLTALEPSIDLQMEAISTRSRASAAGGKAGSIDTLSQAPASAG